MQQFANDHGHSTPKRRLDALWDLARWFDEQAGVPDDTDIAWASGSFCKGVRAGAIAAMCNGVLVASDLPTSVTGEHVESVGTELLQELEAVRGDFTPES